MGKVNKKQKSLYIRCTDELWVAISQAALNTRRKKNDLIIDSITEYLKKYYPDLVEK